MAWTKTDTGFTRSFDYGDAVDLSTGYSATLRLRRTADSTQEVTLTSQAGDIVLSGSTLTVTIPTAVAQAVKQNGGAFAQLEVYDPSGEVRYLYGRDVVVGDTDITPVVTVNPLTALRQAIVDATTVATVKAAILAYLDALP